MAATGVHQAAFMADWLRCLGKVGHATIHRSHAGVSRMGLRGPSYRMNGRLHLTAFPPNWDGWKSITAFVISYRMVKGKLTGLTAWTEVSVLYVQILHGSAPCWTGMRLVLVGKPPYCSSGGAAIAVLSRPHTVAE